MSAQELVDRAEKTSVGIPLNISKLITQLAEMENISFDDAARKVYLAIAEWRKNCLATVSQTVRTAIIKETGNPSEKELQFSEDE